MVNGKEERLVAVAQGTINRLGEDRADLAQETAA
ncbi:MAG: hypothetical protein GAK41_00993 [Burkholderia gladioli]|nr:MAG: hypothetical protein GAK41_00993 [Burkholderia gladioli]